MTERKVGFYECSQCSTRFPHVYGRQKLKIVKTEQWQDLKTSLSEAEDAKAELGERVGGLERERDMLHSEVRTLGEKLVLAKLEGKAETLQREIEILTSGKRELEEEVRNYTQALNVPSV